MTAVHPSHQPPLDRSSNIGIFEAVATPHMLDANRLEMLRENHAFSELPVGRGAQPSSAASITNIIQSGLEPATTTVAASPPPPPVAGWPASPSSPRSPRSPGAASAGSRASPGNVDHMLAELRSIASSADGGAARSPSVPDIELQRLQQRAQAPAEPASLEQMRAAYTARTSDAAPGDGTSYTTMFRDLCRSRHIAAPGGAGGAPPPHCDKDYSEKRELLIKLDELRALGYSVPQFALQMPLEDLQSEYNRRTVSTSTVSTVETVAGWLCTAATMIESLNRLAGPLLPMDNYGENVKAQLAQPRAKYALYQIVLRWQGRSGSSPYRELITILLLPLIQGILVKVVQWLAKGRVPLPETSISSGISSLFSMAKADPDAGVPAGIPGISADVPAPPAAPVPDLPTITNPFATPGPTPSAAAPPNPFVNHAEEAAAAGGAAAEPPPVGTSAASGRRRPRLQRANEVRAGMVLTKAQAGHE